MEISPRDSDKLKQEERKQMSDVATANFLVEQIGGKRHVGKCSILRGKSFRSASRTEMTQKNRWTERRLKAWRHNESRCVEHFQMMELYATAEAMRAARNEHAEYRAKTARLRQMAELRKAALNSDVAPR